MVISSFKDLAAALPHLVDQAEPGPEADDSKLVFEARLPARVGVDQVGALRALLKDAHRTWPVVLVAPWANGAPGPLRNYAYVLAEDLDGAADVVMLEGRETTLALTELVGREQSAYNGAVRVMMPVYVDRLASGVRDFLFKGQDLAAMAPGPQLELIASEVDRQLRLLEQQDAPESALAKAGAAGRRRVRSEAEGPRTVLAAIEEARAGWPHLLFLEEALRSAKASPYGNIPLLLGDFGKLEAAAADMKDGLGRGWLELMKRHGLGGKYSKNISDTSRQAYADEYLFEYDGERRLFEHHITIGVRHNEAECISVHFWPDAARGRLVIGHVGAHLTTKGTG